MSAHTFPIRYIARFTIEAKTPFLIGSGSMDLFSDAVFVSDANGLPALPGSSLAGVLRHAFSKRYPGRDDRYFGFPGNNKVKGQGSRLTFSWGCIHDSRGVPVEGLVDQDRLSDPVLANARHSRIRDHVRISHRGSAVDKGKFDERCVAAGHRFTFEVMLEGSDADKADWQCLLGFIAGGAFRVGGKTRRGYGAFRVLSVKERAFDLLKRDGFEAFSLHPVSLAAAMQGTEQKDSLSAGVEGRAVVSAALRLRPEGFWMIGGGAGPDADMHPVKETRIRWENDTGAVSGDEVLIPGTAVKGALAHRVAYHYNAAAGVFADELAAVKELEVHSGSENKGVKELFGYSKDKETDDDEGRKGCVIIDDQFVVGQQQKIVNHVAIDRFTGGAIPGALFAEKPIYGGDGFELEISVENAGSISPQARRALAAAINDLAEGRLALGSGAGRGNGFFRAEGGIRWSDGGAWIGGAS